MESLDISQFDDIPLLLIRLSINLCVVLMLVWGCYWCHHKDRNYFFNFLLINLMVFFICFTLKKIDLGLGMALGLFAVFSVIRFRTDTMPVKEMTYLFIVIGVAVINALPNGNTSYGELLIVNVVILFVTYLLERTFDAGSVEKQLGSFDLVYDRLDLLAPHRAEELQRDLQQRTGIPIERFRVKKVDLAKGTAAITIRYRKQ